MDTRDENCGTRDRPEYGPGNASGSRTRWIGWVLLVVGVIIYIVYVDDLLHWSGVDLDDYIVRHRSAWDEIAYATVHGYMGCWWFLTAILGYAIGIAEKTKWEAGLWRSGV